MIPSWGPTVFGQGKGVTEHCSVIGEGVWIHLPTNYLLFFSNITSYCCDINLYQYLIYNSSSYIFTQALATKIERVYENFKINKKC